MSRARQCKRADCPGPFAAGRSHASAPADGGRKLKTERLPVVAGVAVPLVLCAPAPAGFVGIIGVNKHAIIGGQPATVFNVFAVCDRPGQDRFLSSTSAQRRSAPATRIRRR